MRLARRLLTIVAIAALVVSASSPASATINGPCTASLNGQDVSAGFDTADTAVKVDYNSTVSVGGSVTGGGKATAVKYVIELFGIKRDIPVTISTGQRSSSWSGQVEVSKYAWATVGLFKVLGAASTSAGRCTGVVLVCVSGKNPLTTAAGGVAGAGFVGGLLALAVTIAKVKGQAAGIAAMKAFFPAAIMAEGGALLLQQTCVQPITATTGLIVPIAIAIGGGALAPIVGGIMGVKPPPGGYPTTLRPTEPPPTDGSAPEPVTVTGPRAIDALIAAGAKRVPGTIYVRPPETELPGIMATGGNTITIPDPDNPGQTIEVLDPTSTTVLVDPAVSPPPRAPDAPTTTQPQDPGTTTTTQPQDPTTTTTQPKEPPITTGPSGGGSVAPPTQPQPPVGPRIPDTPLITALTPPGGGTATIPPGTIGPLLPQGFVDGNGNFRFPPDANVPREIRDMFNGKPPPKLSINSEGNLMIEPQGTAGALATVTGSWVEMTISNSGGTISGSSSLTTGFGLGPSMDLNAHVRPVFDAINARLRDSNVQITDIKTDARSGITITTGPLQR